MRRLTLLSRAALISVFALVSANAGAQLDVEYSVDVDFYPERAEAECYIRVGEDEPYSAFHGDCKLYKGNEPVVVNTLRNVPITYPRSTDWSRKYYAVPWNTALVLDSIYCGSFGFETGGANYLILGHATNSSDNVYLPEAKICDNSPSATTANCVFSIEPNCEAPGGLPGLFTLVSASVPGVAASHVDINYLNGLSGPWHDLYEGVFTCPGMFMDTIRKFHALVTTVQGISQCEIVVDPSTFSCPPGGPGGGGPFN